MLYCLDNMRIGGSELNAVRTAERLDRTRFHVTVACLSAEGPLVDRYRAAGINVLRFPITSLYGVSAVRSGLALARELTHRRIDIVHSHDMYSNVFAAPWTRLARRPVLITSRRWWHSLPPARLRVANRYAFRVSDCVLANSAAVANSVQTADGVSPDRIAVVSNFADDSAFEPLSPAAVAALRRELSIPPDAFVLGMVARLDPVKDHATLLHAFAQLRTRYPALHLVIVGDGQCSSPLRALAKRLEVARAVTFAGERTDGVNYHQLFDVSVLSSLSEGFPNSIVEAMAAGRPVVATAVGGNVDAVDPDSTGILVPPAAPEAVARAIGRLIEDPQLRRAMGLRGQSRARLEFAADRVVARLEALYERLAMRVAA